MNKPGYILVPSVGRPFLIHQDDYGYGFRGTFKRAVYRADGTFVQGEELKEAAHTINRHVRGAVRYDRGMVAAQKL